jgi:hypothetical protein
MCTKGIYAGVPHVSSSTIEATVEGSEREVSIEKPNIVAKVPSIRVSGARPKPHELIWYDWFTQLDLSTAAIEPRWFFWKPLRTAVVAIRDRL